MDEFKVLLSPTETCREGLFMFANSRWMSLQTKMLEINLLFVEEKVWVKCYHFIMVLCEHPSFVVLSSFYPISIANG